MTFSLWGIFMLKALKFLLYSLRSRYMFFPQSDSRRIPDPVGKNKPHLRNNSCLFRVGWRSNYTSKHTLFQRKRRTEHIGSKWGRYNHQPLWQREQKGREHNGRIAFYLYGEKDSISFANEKLKGFCRFVIKVYSYHGSIFTYYAQSACAYYRRRDCSSLGNEPLYSFHSNGTVCWEQ